VTGGDCSTSPDSELDRLDVLQTLSAAAAANQQRCSSCGPQVRLSGACMWRQMRSSSAFYWRCMISCHQWRRLYQRTS